METIKLKSSKNQNNYLMQFEDSDYYLVKSSSPFINAGKVGDLDYISLFGGPKITVGQVLTDVGKIVKDIKSIRGIGILISFEK